MAKQKNNTKKEKKSIPAPHRISVNLEVAVSSISSFAIIAYAQVN